MKNLIWLICVCVLSGCGAHGIINGELLTQPVPVDKARLIVIRDNAFRSGGLAAYVSINGVRVAELARNATFVTDISVGRNVISVTTAGDPGDYTSILDAKKMQTYKYRIGANEGKSMVNTVMFGFLGDTVDAASNQNTGYLQIVPTK